MAGTKLYDGLVLVSAPGLVGQVSIPIIKNYLIKQFQFSDLRAAGGQTNQRFVLKVTRVSDNTVILGPDACVLALSWAKPLDLYIPEGTDVSIEVQASLPLLADAKFGVSLIGEE